MLQGPSIALNYAVWELAEGSALPRPPILLCLVRSWTLAGVQAGCSHLQPDA